SLDAVGTAGHKASVEETRAFAYPDTLVGTDSHTTMINGLGVLGWGVGGIEAEAAMLGQPVSMRVPEVVGFKLTGKLKEGTVVEGYYREQGLFHTADAEEAVYSATIALDLATVEPSVAGPKRPQDRVKLSQAGRSFKEQLPSLLGPNGNTQVIRQMVRWEGEGGTASASGDLSSSIGASAPVVEAPVVPVIT